MWFIEHINGVVEVEVRLSFCYKREDKPEPRKFIPVKLVKMVMMMTMTFFQPGVSFHTEGKEIALIHSF